MAEGLVPIRPTAIYLAARYVRRAEMAGYADQLRRVGIHVTSRWLEGTHEALDGIPDHPMRERWACEDVEDVLTSTVHVNFTELPENSGGARGGRHVEFGIAYAMEHRLIVVGPRENIFHHLPDVERFETWDEAFGMLRADYGSWPANA